MKAKRLSKANRLPSDRITTLPETIIETILCLLPIEEAARTSILSSEWRYKWTKIPKLSFFNSTVERSIEWKPLCQCESENETVEREEKDMRCKLFCAIHQVLLLRQAPIQEFTLSVNAYDTCCEIDQIILHLSMNHKVKKLTLDFWDEFRSYGLPSSFSSLHHLTNLYLGDCHFNHKQKFNGFGSLKSLSLIYVKISKECLLRLLSNCPSLKSLCQLIFEQDLHGYENFNLVELFKCLPMIEHLTTLGCIMASDQASVLGELPTSPVHLKSCSIEDMGLVNVYELTFLAILMKCSPNLEKIKLEIRTYDMYSVELEECSSVLKKYSDVWLEHMNELKIENFSNFEAELEFVKFVLARSPNLKKVILLTYMKNKNEELQVLKILLHAPRASKSPVEIFVKSRFQLFGDDG